MPSTSVVVELLACPFCGLSELLVGVTSASSYGVECRCGASVHETTPEKWPKGVRKKGASEDEHFIALHKWMLSRAVMRWNTRSAVADRGERFPHQTVVFS